MNRTTYVGMSKLKNMIKREVQLVVEASEQYKATNRQLFMRYASTFGMKAARGLENGQWVFRDPEGDIVGSFESSSGAYTTTPVFWFRQFQEDTWSGRPEDPYIMSSDEADKAFTRVELERAINTRQPLHDTQPSRKTR